MIFFDLVAIFDRRLLRARLARAAAIGPATFLLDRVADDIAERLSAVLRTFDIALDLGTPTDAVRRAIRGRVGTIAAVVADEEALPFRDASLDLVVSALTLQFVNDLPGALIQIRRALKADGLLLAALIGAALLSRPDRAAPEKGDMEGGKG